MKLFGRDSGRVGKKGRRDAPVAGFWLSVGTVLVCLSVTLATVPGTAGAGVPPGPPADWFPGEETTMLYVTADLESIVVELPVPHDGYPEPDPTDGVSYTQQESTERLARSLYGGFATTTENPDYLVILGFRHDGHDHLYGTAWMTDYSDVDEDGRVKTRQVIYSRSGGVNHFEGPGGGYDTGSADGNSDTERPGETGFEGNVDRPANFRFLLSDEDGYGHVHCAPRQNMYVEVSIYELDRSTGAEWSGKLASGIASGAVSLTGVTGVGTVSSWLASNMVTTGLEADYIGGGEGYLEPEGTTTISIGITDWVDWPDDDVPEEGEAIDYWTEPGLEGRWDVPEFYRAGTVASVPRYPPGSPRAGERLGDDIAITQHRGEVTFSTTVREVGSEIFDEVDAHRLGEAAPTQRTNCNPPPDGFQTDGDSGAMLDSHDGDGSHHHGESRYYHAQEAAFALASSLRDQPLATSEFPGVARPLVADRRVNVHVGEVVFGVTTGTDRIERLTLGGDDDASVRVRMSPDTAWSVAYSSDPIRAVREGLASGAITYEGIGFGNVAMVETVRLGGSAAQFVDRTIVARLPTSYDIATGDQREITHQGQSVVLERNALGHRIIDGGGDTLGVVDRRGESVGVTTRGVQRLVAAPTPSGWTPFSRPSVGVYAQWTAQQAGPGLTLHLPAHGWRGA